MGEEIYLSRSNFKSWQKAILKKLQSEGLSVWIDRRAWPDLEKVPSVFDKYRLQQHKERALACLKQFLTPEVEPLVEDIQDPAEVWSTLKTNFELTGRTPKAFLYAEYQNVRIGHDEDLPSFIARLDSAYRRLKDGGEDIPETQRIYKLLENIPSELDYLVREFERLDDASYTYDRIKSDIISEVNRKELRERQRNEVYSAGASTSKVKHELPQPQPERKVTVRCRRCGKIGHYDKDCRSKISDKTFVTELVDAKCFASEVMPPSWTWTLDSASTAHICQNKDFFISLKSPPPNMIVRMGTTPHAVCGIGSIKFQVKDQGRLRLVQLKEALYVPSIHRNLISMSKMDKAGYHAKMNNGFQIYNPQWKYCYTAHLEKQFYVLRAVKPKFVKKEDSSSKDAKLKKEGSTKTNGKVANKFSEKSRQKPNRGAKDKEQKTKVNEAYSSETDNIMLWHERLGHFNVQYVQKMFKDHLVEPEKVLKGKPEKCEPCTLAKSTRQPHPRLQAIRSKSLLELIHCDVWGPSPVSSRNQHRYLLTCIDDFSRRAFCYPLRTKDQVMSKIIDFITFAERQTGKQVKVIRTDNGLEFCSRAMEEYLTKHGIKHERTSISSPQMNGCAERYNRVLFEGVRTLQIAANLPNNLWTEMAMAVNYLKNRVYHATIEDVPFKRWYNKKPTVKHLRRYGCIAYVHLPKDRRTSKFQPRAKKGILVGYGLGTAGYRIWIPQENIVMESKHVTFDEGKLGRQAANEQDRSLNLDDDNPFSFQIPSTQEIEEAEEPATPEPVPTTSRVLTAAELKQELPLSPESGPGERDESDSMSEDEQVRVDPGKVKFNRYQTVTKKGITKGRINTYIETPLGEIIRSGKKLQEFCEENKIRYDNSLANFKATNNYQGPIFLERIDEEALCTEVIIPRSPKQAKLLPEAEHWQEAMDLEIQTMLDRKVWTPVPYDEGNKIIGTRWVYTVKKDINGEISTYKARLVALGNMQREGLDYEETFSPVINFTLIRLLMVLFTCILKWVNCLLDVKCAYLYGNIDKKIFIRQPDGYKLKGKENHILRLNKAIYGLHQAGRCWHHDLRDKLLENNFQEIKGVTCAFVYESKAIVLVYVDDMPIFAKDEETLNEVVNIISQIYDVKNMGEINQLLGVNFDKENNMLKNMNCAQYIYKCMKKYDINNTNVSLPTTPGFQPEPIKEGEQVDLPTVKYRSLLGSLMYIAQKCRPDISWATTSLAQFTEKHGMTHYNALMKVLLYLAATPTLGVAMMESDDPIQLTCYADAAWNATLPDRKSWSAYILLVNGVPVSWRVKKQTKVSASPLEAEYVAAAEASKEIIYLDMVLAQIKNALKLDVQIQRPIMYVDNTAAINFLSKQTVNVSTRYISLDYNFVKDYYQQKFFDISYVPSKDNLADILTKALPRDSYLKLRSRLMI